MKWNSNHPSQSHLRRRSLNSLFSIHVMPVSKNFRVCFFFFFLFDFAFQSAGLLNWFRQASFISGVSLRSNSKCHCELFTPLSHSIRTSGIHFSLYSILKSTLACSDLVLSLFFFFFFFFLWLWGSVYFTLFFLH